MFLFKLLLHLCDKFHESLASAHGIHQVEVPGKQINRFCASGLEAVNTAAAQVMSGQSQLVIGGGVESMSRIPMGSDGGAWPIDPAVSFCARPADLAGHGQVVLHLPGLDDDPSQRQRGQRLPKSRPGQHPSG